MLRVHAIVEGATEKQFVDKFLNPYLGNRGINIFCQQINGNINFDRVKVDVLNTLKEDKGAYVTTMFDYYGIDSQWPGVQELQQDHNNKISVPPLQIEQRLQQAFVAKLKEQLSDDPLIFARFIPYFEIHEFEALLFSDLKTLAAHINCKVSDINSIIRDLSPEEINTTKETSPKSRLKSLCYKKIIYSETATSYAIAEKIKIDTMREKCLNFDNWLKKLEELAKHADPL